MEVWRDIEGYEGLYQVSNLGRIKSLNYNKKGVERIMKVCKDKKGYIVCGLSKNKNLKTFKVHRLVASAFLSNPNNLPQINHKDEDKTNNRVENIEYCNNDYNRNYGTRNKRASASCRKPILQFTKEDVFIRKWDGAIEVEKELGFDNSSITKCCKGKQKSAYGFVWMYAVINGFSIDINKLKRVA
jgi:hypothetical protein